MLRIFCDFDGTICTQDSLQTMLHRYAAPQWLEIEDAWNSGQIDTQTCLRKQASLMKFGDQEILQLATHSQLTPGFIHLERWCRQYGIPLVILSDGLSVLLSAILKKHRLEHLPMFSNHATQQGGQWTITFPHTNPSHPDCAVCKGALIQRLCQTNDHVVYFGDGRSDRCAVHHATHIFAKDSLATYCDGAQLRYTPWRDFYYPLQQLKRLYGGSEQLAQSTLPLSPAKHSLNTREHYERLIDLK